MRIHFIGDCHGRWQALHDVIRSSEAEALFQVGDLGYFPHLAKYTPNIPDSEDYGRRRSYYPEAWHPKTYWIEGNHDDIVSLRSDGFSHPNFEYVPRATLLDLGGVRVACLGGGVSLDRRYRTQGVDWFPEEVPTSEEFSKFFDLVESGVDVVVTHEAPEGACDMLDLPTEYHSQVSYTLEGLRRSLSRPPKVWVSGHHHRDAYGDLGGVHYRVLGCCHHHNGMQPSYGWVYYSK